MTDTKGLIVTISAVLSALALLALVALHVVSVTESRDEAADVIAEVRKDLKEPHYEYKVLSVQAEGHDRTGDAAMKFATVTPSSAELTALGATGWEVVSSYLEIETAYPNFGKAEYVTGLQPNVRPQRLVIILRHRTA